LCHQGDGLFLCVIIWEALSFLCHHGGGPSLFFVSSRRVGSFLFFVSS
jgi:hypothetical protein